MQKLLHKIFFFTVLLSLGYNAIAQEVTVTYHWNDPLCPDPPNGSLNIEINDVSGIYGVYDSLEVWLENTTAHESPITHKIKITDATSYSYTNYGQLTFSNLTYGQRYIAYVKAVNYSTTSGKDLGALGSDILEKPKFSASINKLRDAGCRGQAVGQAELSISSAIEPCTWQWHQKDGSYATHDNEKTVQDLTPGFFYASVTDARGCTINSDTLDVDSIDIIISAAVVKNVLCKTVAEGEAAASVQNAYGTYLFSWNGGTPTSDATCNTLPAGKNIVSVEDEIGCQDTTEVTITEPDTKIEISLQSSADLVCKDAPTGKASFSTTNAVGATTYTWSDGGSGDNRSDLYANINYKIIVTDEDGCKDSTNVQLSQPDTKVEVSVVSSQQPKCYGGSDGEISATATGGDSGIYTYQWNRNDGTATASNIVAGDWEIIATDGNGCTDTLLYTLDQPAKIGSEFIYTENGNPADNIVSCHGDKVDVTVNVTGGVLPIQYYQWNEGAKGTETSITSGAGKCKVVMEDANGCVDSVVATIVEPEELTLALSEKTQIRCNGDLGEVEVVPSGGTAPYNYAWSTGSTTATSGDVPDGTYDVTVTDANACVTTNSYKIAEPDSVLAHIRLSDEACKKITNGNLSVDVLGGRTPYTYEWSTGATTSTLGGLSATTYYVTVKDKNGCSDADTIDLTTANKYSLSWISTRVKCVGQSNGTATVKIKYGYSPFTVEWNTGAKEVVSTNQHKISDIPAGTYHVTVTDDRGCTLSTDPQVNTIKSVLIKSVVTTETACLTPTGTATATVKYGTLPYTYQWSNGASTKKNTAMAAGSYNLKVIDGNGCETDTTIEIKKKALLQVEVLSPDTTLHCVGANTGEVYAIAMSGVKPYSYSWSNGDSGDWIYNLGKGTYTVTVVDGEGCEASKSIEFVEDDVLRIEDDSIQNVSCNGGNNGAIAVTIAGGFSPYEISWNTGATTTEIDNLVAGTYTATITDAGGCTITKDFIVTEPEFLSIAINNVTSIQCIDRCDASAEANVTGGTAPYSYAWSSDETNAKALKLCYGNQSLHVTDAHGCEATKDFAVSGRSERLQVTSTTINEPICAEASPSGSISVVPEGAIDGTTYVYSWSFNNTEIATTNAITNCEAGAYKLHLTDNTCEFDTIINLSHKMTAIATVDRLYSDCTGEAYQLSISNESTANYTYEWSNGATTKNATGLSTGTYTVKATDKSGCILTKTVNIVEQPIAIQVDVLNDANCYGTANGSAEVSLQNADGTVTYEWKNTTNNTISTTNTATNLAKGTYTVTAYDSRHAACPASQSIDIQEPAKIKLLFNANPSYCLKANGSTAVSVIGGQAPYTYNWYDKNSAVVSTTDTLKNIEANEDYFVTVTDVNGCSMTQNTRISDISNFSLFGVQTASITCEGRSDAELQIYTNNGYKPFTYSWSHDKSLNSHIAKNVGIGNYSVEVTDSKGCSAIFSFLEVENPTPISVAIEESPQIMCYGGKGNLLADVSGGTAPYNYTWLDSTKNIIQSSNLDEITDLYSGKYFVVVTDAYDCPSDSLQYVLNDPTQITADFSVKVTECGDRDNVGEITLNSISGGVSNTDYRFQWGKVNDGNAWTNYEDDENRTLSGLTAGEYYCTITNALTPDECYITKTFNTSPSMPDAIITIPSYAHCNYYSPDDIANNKPDGTIEITNLTISEGDYTIKTTASLDDYEYLWNDDKHQKTIRATNLPVGRYEVTITGSNQCSRTFTIDTLDANVNLYSAIFSIEDTTFIRKEICFEDSLDVKLQTEITLNHSYIPTGGYESYQWDVIENNASAKIYSPDKQETNVKPQTKYYSDSTELVAYFTSEGCQAKPAHYSISHFDSINFSIQVFDTVGTYLGTDSAGVIKNNRYIVLPNEEPWYIDKTGDNGIASIWWHSYDVEQRAKGTIPDATTDENSYNKTGIYGLSIIADEANYLSAIATTINGCYERAMTYLNVYATIFIPSGFTPNGDGTNDTWMIPYLSICPNAVVTVFNRWGSKVYECDRNYYEHPWDGTSNGHDLPMGTYYYVIEYNDPNHTPTQTGSVSILR